MANKIQCMEDNTAMIVIKVDGKMYGIVDKLEPDEDNMELQEDRSWKSLLSKAGIIDNSLRTLKFAIGRETLRRMAEEAVKGCCPYCGSKTDPDSELASMREEVYIYKCGRCGQPYY